MVTIIRDRVTSDDQKGLALDQIKAARPTLDYEPRYGSITDSWTTAMFTESLNKNLGGVDDACVAAKRRVCTSALSATMFLPCEPDGPAVGP